MTRTTQLNSLTQLAVGAWLSVFASQALAVEPLTLRVNDTVAAPGGIAAVTLRTYASRPIGQGQLCMVFALRSVSGGPIEAVEGAEVFSIFGDTTHGIFFDENDPSQATMVDFASPDAGINAHDGPLAVIFFRVRADAIPGTEYDLSIDMPNTFLVDANGKSVTVEPRAGRLRIRAPQAPVSLSGAAEDSVSGEIASFGIATEEQYFVASGQVAIRYGPMDPGWIKVSMDPRYGTASFDVLHWPGTVFVSFVSSDATLNRVPGNLINVTIPTSAGMTRPLVIPITLDPALTVLRDASGAVIPVDLDSDNLVITPGPVQGPIKPRPVGPFLRR